MGLQNDWIMQQIEMITRFVAKVIFNKDDSQNTFWYELEDSENLSETDKIYIKINSLLKENKLCEAEDILFENITFSDKYAELATDFYKRLNNLSNKELESCNFSRNEIYEGYIDILTQLGIPVEQFKL